MERLRSEAPYNVFLTTTMHEKANGSSHVQQMTHTGPECVLADLANHNVKNRLLLFS